MLEEFLFGAGDADMAFGKVVGQGRDCRKIGFDPGGDHRGGVMRVGLAAEQVARLVQADEALGMFRRGEDLRGIFDADDLVARGVEDEQCRIERGKPVGLVVALHLRDEIGVDDERAAADLDFCRLARARLGGAVGKMRQDMIDREGRAYRRNRGDAGQVLRHGDHRSTAETVTDEQRRRRKPFGQGVAGGLEVGDIAGEMAIGKLAFAFAEPGKVEAQRRQACLGEGTRDVARGKAVLRAGEAMREQRGCPDRARRAFERRRQHLAVARREGEILGHARSSFVALVIGAVISPPLLPLRLRCSWRAIPRAT